MLPLYMSNETHIQQLMTEASEHYKANKLKTSYDLYIEALLYAINEFKQLKFIDDNIITENSLSSVFILATLCLGHVKDISLHKSARVPPAIPIKPSNLSFKSTRTHPPPLPIRPEMKKKQEHSFSTDRLSLEIDTNRSISPESITTTTTINPLNMVRTLLSLPSSTVHDSTKKMTSECRDNDDLFLLTNSTINPLILLPVQTSHSDTLSQSSSSEYLPIIPQAPLITAYQALQHKLDEEECLLAGAKMSNVNTQPHIIRISDLKMSLNRVRNIHMSATTVPTILQFNPVIIAYQLTLIDSALFRKIPIQAILTHSPKTPHTAITASTDFFNYLTRFIEHTILLQQEASGRALQINHWIKVAGKCHELKNYQTLKAIVSALGTPPIQRLKRAWAFVPKKSMLLLDELGELMSEASNYGKYRERIGILSDLSGDIHETDAHKKKSPRKNSFSEPTVPFLGIFIHDMTYLNALEKNHWIEKDSVQHDSRVQELLRLVQNLQRSPPYSPNMTPFCIKDLNRHRKRKLSHALTRNATSRRSLYEDETGEFGVEMQQCLVTQYLLTRSWVSEKTVDELSLIREPTKTIRSYSLTEYTHPPAMTPSLSSGLRNSAGSLRTSVSSSDHSRPISLEDDLETSQQEDDRKPSFWLFSKRKSIDQGSIKDSFSLAQRPPRHFSFDEINNTLKSFNKKKESGLSVEITHSVKMQREGSLPSIFRKDFWKGNAHHASSRQPLINFHSEPSLITNNLTESPSYNTSLSDHPIIHYKHTHLHPLDSSSTTQSNSLDWIHKK